MDEKIRREDNRDAYYEEEPDWMEYLERERETDLNRNRGAFYEKDTTSINIAASVFEKGTIFHVSDKADS